MKLGSDILGGGRKIRLKTPGRADATSSRLDGVVEGVAVLVTVVGWPSAVGLFVAHKWSHLFGSDVARDVVAAFFVMGAGFAALAFAVMGLGPWAAGQTGGGYERISGRSLLVLVAVAFAPTIVLAFFLYGLV